MPWRRRSIHLCLRAWKIKRLLAVCRSFSKIQTDIPHRPRGGDAVTAFATPRSNSRSPGRTFKRSKSMVSRLTGNHLMVMLSKFLSSTGPRKSLNNALPARPTQARAFLRMIKQVGDSMASACGFSWVRSYLHHRPLRVVRHRRWKPGHLAGRLSSRKTETFVFRRHNRDAGSAYQAYDFVERQTVMEFDPLRPSEWMSFSVLPPFLGADKVSSDRGTASRALPRGNEVLCALAVGPHSLS